MSEKIRVMDEVNTPEGVGCVSEFNEWGEVKVWFEDKEPQFLSNPVWRTGKYKWFKREDVTK